MGAWCKTNRASPYSDPKEEDVSAKTQGAISIAAACFVLFRAMWDPRISVALSVIALAALGVYGLVQRDR